MPKLRFYLSAKEKSNHTLVKSTVEDKIEDADSQQDIISSIIDLTTLTETPAFTDYEDTIVVIEPEINFNSVEYTTESK